MTLRELSKMDGAAQLGIAVEGRLLRAVTYQGNCVYLAYFGTGEILEGKGHQKPEQLRFPRQLRSSDRIQRYGEFGTSI
jgi:hypothetical protein